jgi:teichuronic acid biosynthesis glycosyltransferase TuaH
MNQHVVWMAGVPWDDNIHGTDWHMVTAMARDFRVLWVDPPVSPVRALLRLHADHRTFRPRISVVADRVTRLTPVAMPGLTRLGIRSTTAPLVRLQTRWALRRLRIQPIAVVATYPGDLLGYWGDDVVNVFYGTDDYVAGARLMGLSARHLLKEESRAVARADAVIAVSPHLADQLAELGGKPVVIPNGCWSANPSVREAPPEVKDLKQPVVGLIGQLSERIDISILYAIADAGISLLIVGPLDPRWEPRGFKELIAKANVRYTGSVPAAAVPCYLAGIDVGITPYRDTPFNRASFPLKTLEYLGAGVPVVSTGIPAAEWLHANLASGQQAPWADQVMRLARNGDDFVEAILKIAEGVCSPAAGSDCPGAAQDLVAARCVAFAADHTWERRAVSLASAMRMTEAEAAAG